MKLLSNGGCSFPTLQSGFRLSMTSEQVNVMGYIYILKSNKKNKYYIGSTKRSVAVKLLDHNVGRVISTKHDRPWSIVVTKEYATYSEARSVELRLKKLKRKDYLKKIEEDGYIRL
ncbi:MAG: GIY-YIG nuclease superfamily protein [Microgenomates bacterium OLB22]|nr:MAG: GIY-YIG nuclease superfamily protein [Microgenomates bacterium OLB22]